MGEPTPRQQDQDSGAHGFFSFGGFDFSGFFAEANAFFAQTREIFSGPKRCGHCAREVRATDGKRGDENIWYCENCWEVWDREDEAQKAGLPSPTEQCKECQQIVPLRDGRRGDGKIWYCNACWKTWDQAHEQKESEAS